MPNVMRVSPVPLYNSFTDVYNFISTLRQIFDDLAQVDQGIILGDSAEEAICHEYSTNSASSSSSCLASSSDSELDSSEAALAE